MRRRRSTPQDGFTLLEVILAIAVLGLSIVAIGDVTRLAYRNAELAADELEAKLLAESIVGELLTGGRELVAVAATPVEVAAGELPRYSYAIDVEGTAQANIMLLRVRVLPVDAETDVRPLCELTRWMIDPAFLAQLSAAAAATQ